MKKWHPLLIPSLSTLSAAPPPPPPPPPPPITALIRRGLYPQALLSSALHPSSPFTLQLLPPLLKSTSSLDLRLATLLISRLSISGDIAAARAILLHLPAPDTAAWNALIAGCAHHHLTHPAFHSFNDLHLRGLRPDAFTFSSLLKASSSHFQATQIAHASAVKLALSSAAYVVSGLVHNYSKAGDLRSAEKSFEEDSSVLDPVAWTAMISGYVKNGEFCSASRVFMQMRCLGLCLNEFCLASVLAAIAGEGYGVIEQGVQVHGLCVKMGFLPFGSKPLSNALLSMYCRCGTREDGLRAFWEIRDPDVVSWSTFIGVLEGDEAVNLFIFLCSTGKEINEYTLINVLSALGGDIRLLKCGMHIQTWCLKSGFPDVVSIGNALISMYGRCGKVDAAERVFGEMFDRDLVSWNAMIAVYAANCLPGPALLLFSRMRCSMLDPNASTLTSLFEAISYNVNPGQVRQMHSYMMKSGHISNGSMAAILITSYGRCNAIDESIGVFNEVDERALVHINTLAAAFVQVGCHADALKLFKTTRSLGGEVDNATVSVVLKASCALTLIETGRSIHSVTVKLGLHRDDFVGSALIDLYCKCGSLGDAIKVFEELAKSSLATWNAMITGYAQHGDHAKVIQKFEEMQLLSSLCPDEVTFLGVLYSCCHGGHVKEAYHYLDSMLKDHGLVPSVEHYACLIDLLGRVGCLEEAKSSIDGLPLLPDARIWQSFLMSCAIHRSVEFGEVAAKELLILEPGNDSAYVLLSNIYASVGMWDEVRRLRRGMREKIVMKEPGCSWIQMRGSVHYFFASDTSHPQTFQICLMLEELSKQVVDEMRI